MNLEELANQKNGSLTANDREILAAVFRDKQAVKNMDSTQPAGQPYEMVAAFYILLDILSVRYLEYEQNRRGVAMDEDGFD
ncbi:MAG: hypothetical protein HFG61_08175 [Lachnospiraceae bacterium]|nr:hypothetical protein [Lachnospiraceae bacterium]